MDEADTQALLREILAIEKRITAMGQDDAVRRRWNLSGGPLKLVIGSDNECYALHRKTGHRIGELDTCQKDENKLIKIVWNKCNRQLCARPYEDSSALELNLNPGSAENIIKTYLALAEKIPPLAKKQGWDFAMGAGHWHLSIEDTGGIFPDRHLLSGGYWYSAFSRQLAKDLIALQCICPALFLRPSRSEKDHDTYLYTRTLTHELNRSGTIRMERSEHYPNGALLFEMRMAHLAPYVPVLLLCHTIERTLKGEKIDAQNYGSVKLGYGDRFVRGKGCHFDDIVTTAESGYLEQHFPHLRPLLLTACVQSYIKFLKTPSRSTMYDGVERAAAIEAVQHRFPAESFNPAPPEIAVANETAPPPRLQEALRYFRKMFLPERAA